MEQPLPGLEVGAVALEGILPTLARSKKVQKRLSEEWGAARLASALAMMKAGKLEGTLGDDIHDFFGDEIENEAHTVWSGSISVGNDSYSIEVQEYEGVYFVWALEQDSVGYFLNLEDAKKYIDTNWWGDVQEDDG